MTPEAITELRNELQETKVMIEQQEETIKNLKLERDALSQMRDDLEIRFSSLDVDYEELLDKTILMEEMDVKQRSDIAKSLSDYNYLLESQFNQKSQGERKEIASLTADKDKLTKEEHRLAESMKELQEEHQKLLKMNNEPAITVASSSVSKETVEQKEKELEKMRKSLSQELIDFEITKKVLMRDLQSRCEKVVELEIIVEEIKAQQNSLLRANSNRAQQKKMAVLERNLEQLTNVQKEVIIQL
jgi:kinesin family protein 5